MKRFSLVTLCIGVAAVLLPLAIIFDSRFIEYGINGSFYVIATIKGRLDGVNGPLLGIPEGVFPRDSLLMLFLFLAVSIGNVFPPKKTV